MLEKKIAIVGMDCKLPGAVSIPQFWDNLCSKRSGILRLAGADRMGMHLAVGYLGNTDLFDYEYFRMSKREASLIDPQHRLFLTCASNALEYVQKCDFTAKNFGHRVGVFASCPMNTYLPYTKNNVDTSLHTIDGLQATLHNDKDYIALRTAYTLNLTGPAVNIQTSCSSSLVGTHLACRALAALDCDIALVGGASIMTPQFRPYKFIEGGIFSADGQCRPFTKNTSGTVHGNGVAAVVLKRLDDAIRDRNTIFGVIISSAINNDGNRKDGFTAPSAEGQSGVIEHALSGIDVETIGFVEAHGTGTKLGDPVEVAGLSAAFSGKSKKKGYCALGTVKPHIGHLESISGVVGMIKIAMLLNQKQIVSDIYDTEPIDLSNTPFYTPKSCIPWDVKPGIKRRASISSFGIGGTNAHILLEEAPDELAGNIHSFNTIQKKINASRCWIKQKYDRRDHELGIKIKATASEIVYEGLINNHSHAWLKDHLLTGDIIVPGTYFVYLFKNIMQTLNASVHWGLKSIEFRKSMTVSENKTILRTSMRKKENGWGIQIESSDIDNSEFIVHAVAEAVPCESFVGEKGLHLSKLLQGKQYELDVANIYANQVTSSGMYYGPSFQKVRHAVKTSLGILGVIADFENHLKEQIDREVCLLDSCLQLVQLAHGQNEARKSGVYLLRICLQSVASGRQLVSNSAQTPECT